MVLTFLMILAGSAVVQDSKLPVPDAAAQKAARSTVRELFKSDYAKTGLGDRKVLVGKLLRQSIETKDDPNARFVLLQEARSLAAEAGDVATALQAVDELSGQFEVDRVALKHLTLATTSLSARDPSTMSAAAERLLQLVDEALADLNVGVAEKSASQALNMAKASENMPLTARVTAKLKELSGWKSKIAQVQAAKDRLKANPDDGDANLSVGRFTCLTLGKWVSGIPFLAKGSDAALKTLALRDQNGPKEPADQVALADGWWDQSEKEGGSAKEHLRTRAAYWYQEAISTLSGLVRTKVEKRLKDAPLRVVPGLRIDLLRMIDPARDGLSGTWEKSGTSLTSPDRDGFLEVPYASPPEYDLLLTVERKSDEKTLNSLVVVLPLINGKVAAVVDQEGSEEISGLSKIDGKLIVDNGTKYVGRQLRQGISSTVIYAVRRTGVSLYVDGKRIFDWKGDLQRLSFTAATGRQADTICLACNARFLITGIALVPVGEPGKSTR